MDDDAYPGFDAAHASRLKRLDGCFGGFVDDLKQRGLYDDSVDRSSPSDHGDSLGEEGRWGHAYTLVPRSAAGAADRPPAAARCGTRFDADLTAAAFTADITPTLYALLGHQTSQPAPMFGEPLVWPKGSPRSRAIVRGRAGRVELRQRLRLDQRRWPPALRLGRRVAARLPYELDGSPTGRALAVNADDRRAGQAAVQATPSSASAAFYKLELD